MTAPGCDAPAGTGGAYAFSDGSGGLVFRCRCVVCARCGRHTGNSSQGHYWRFCKVTGEFEREWHFCCPGDCEMWP